MVKLRKDNLILSDGSFDSHRWLTEIAKDYSPDELHRLRTVIGLTENIPAAVLMPMGDTCVLHGLRTAQILQALGLDMSTLAAAIVYPAYRYAKLSMKDIEEKCGFDIAQLVSGVEKIDQIAIDGVSGQLENLRRMLITLVEDVRVVLIKLASHTCLMRAAVLIEDASKRKLAEQTREIYAPLANRLGIGQIKWELEDLSFRFLMSEEYKQIAKLLDERRVDREDYIEEVVRKIENTLGHVEVNATVVGRAKHIYSIWKKMQRKGVSYQEIYDVRAIRIIVKTVGECYAALGVVHSLWHHIPKEFDDYIANPKSNGYRSLHTAVIGPEGKTLEIQIRTQWMHEQAELGVAAHWRYKENLLHDAQYESKLINLRNVLKWQEDWVTYIEMGESFGREIFQDWVYVLTPKGEIVELTQGATVLDFAYHVHSEIGNRCRGAKVNGRIVPLTHVLNSGDRVEILTARAGGPSRDWLNRDLGYLKTARARAKVLHWFKRQDKDQHIHDGREILERELKRLGADNLNLESLAHHLKLAKVEEMLAALGNGDLRISQVLHAIQTVRPLLAKPIAPLATLTPSTQKLGTAAVTVSGIGNLLSHMARCCRPIPGDPIIGYITVGKGVAVHRSDCVNILHAKENKLPRLIQVEWVVNSQNRYAVDILIRAYDRAGLLRDITSIFSSEHINVMALNTFVHKVENMVDLTFTVEISGLELLSKVLGRIQHLPNIIEVRRTQS